MEIGTLWPFLLGIATPIAGVVGFAIHLRQVKKLRLENEKLELEIEALKKSQANSTRRIVEVSTEEVVRYAYSDRPVFSRRARTHDHAPQLPPPKTWKITASDLALVAAVLLVITYFLYDVYRLAKWVAGAA